MNPPYCHAIGLATSTDGDGLCAERSGVCAVVTRGSAVRLKDNSEVRETLMNPA